MANVWGVMLTCVGCDDGGALFAEAMPNRCTEYAYRDYDGPMQEVSRGGGGQQGWHLDVWLGSYKSLNIDELVDMLREWTKVKSFKRLEAGERRFFDADLVSCFVCYEEDGGRYARPVQVWPPAPLPEVDLRPALTDAALVQQACSGCNGRATVATPCHACGAFVPTLRVQVVDGPPDISGKAIDQARAEHGLPPLGDPLND